MNDNQVAGVKKKIKAKTRIEGQVITAIAKSDDMSVREVGQEKENIMGMITVSTFYISLYSSRGRSRSRSRDRVRSDYKERLV